MADEGKPVEWLLGIAIQQDVVAGTVHLHMSTVIDKLANLVLSPFGQISVVKNPHVSDPSLEIEREDSTS